MNLEVTVRNTILDIVRETNPNLERVEDHEGLTELGLKSLNLARVVAELDLALEADPFSELVALTSIRTVGDVIGAYRSFLEKAGAGGGTAEDVDEGRRRAAARGDAIAALRDRSNKAG